MALKVQPIVRQIKANVVTVAALVENQCTLFHTHTLLSTMKVAVIRSEEPQDLRDEINKVTRDMETRKKVERAKGILMQTRNMGEQEAYDTIRMISKERNMSMELVAEILLCGSDKE